MNFIVTIDADNGHTYGCTFTRETAACATLFFKGLRRRRMISAAGLVSAKREIRRILELQLLTDDELVERMAEDDMLGEP